MPVPTANNQPLPTPTAPPSAVPTPPPARPHPATAPMGLPNTNPVSTVTPINARPAPAMPVNPRPVSAPVAPGQPVVASVSGAVAQPGPSSAPTRPAAVSSQPVSPTNAPTSTGMLTRAVPTPATNQNFPPPRVANPTRREDWQIGGAQDAGGKVQTVFSGQAPAYVLDAQGKPVSAPPGATPKSPAAPKAPVNTAATDGDSYSLAGTVASSISQQQGHREAGNRAKDPHKNEALGSKALAPRGNGRTAVWPLVLVAGIVAVLAMGVLLRFAGLAGQKIDTKTSQFEEGDPMKMGVAPITPCVPNESKSLVSSIETQVATDAATLISDAPTPEDEALFQTFVKAWRQAKKAKCTEPIYCEQSFAGDQDLRIQIVENSFAEDLNFVPGKKADASAFRARLYGYFGDTDVNWKKYPELAYDESDETFVVPTLAPSEGNYDYHLDHVLFDEGETKLIYVADMIPKSGCRVTLSGNQCACPAAQYYLELHWDEVAGQMNFIRHYVRRQGEISPVEGQ